MSRGVMTSVVGTSDAVNAAVSGGVAPHLTDLGNAHRFAHLNYGELLYCDPLRVWFVFDGQRWQEDTTCEVMRRAKAIVPSIYSEAAAATNEAVRKQIASWAHQSESEARQKAMVSL